MIYSSFWLQHDFLSQSTLNSDFSVTSTSWNSVRYSQCRVSTVSLCQIALILSINSNGKKNLISEILNCLLEWNPKALWRVSVSRLGGWLSILSLNDHYHFLFFFNWGSSNPQRSGSTLKFINSLFEWAFFVSLINSHTQKVKHPSIFCHLSRAVSQWLGGGEVPTFSSSGNTKMSRAGQLRGAVSVFPACPWLALGPPLSRVCPDHLSPEH